MTPEQLTAWAAAAQLLIASGAASWKLIASMLKKSGRSEDEINEVLTLIIQNATERKAVSEQIAG